jgi:glycosyltransferase involved in cell wall biosynthesis
MPGMTRHLNTWVPRSVQRADHVIAVSQATRQDLIELYNTPPKKISVLYHGVSANFAPVTDPARLNEIRQRFGLGQAPFVLSVGTVQPRKNYTRLVQALARLDDHTRLVLAGSKGWGINPLLTEIKKLGLTERVIFTGFVDDADLPALYSAATLFVYPSLYEGFGLPVAEAMACGTPVIASDRSALPEVVGNAGLLIDPEDVAALAQAMAGLLRDDSRRAALSRAGQAQAAKFTWPGMAQQLLALYRQILKNQG